MLSSKCWDNILSLDDPNDATNLFISEIAFCINKSLLKNKKKNKPSIPRKTWITQAIWFLATRNKICTYYGKTVHLLP